MAIGMMVAGDILAGANGQAVVESMLSTVSNYGTSGHARRIEKQDPWMVFRHRATTMIMLEQR